MGCTGELAPPCGVPRARGGARDRTWQEAVPWEGWCCGFLAFEELGAESPAGQVFLAR